ncbi:MAG: nuclear transport factor 2 family protein [Myxococcota bacterium]
MFHRIVAWKIKRVWERIGGGDWRAATEGAAEDVHFHFVGDTPLALETRRRSEWEAWFARVFQTFPGIRFTLEECVVRGWPWRTRFVARVRIEASLQDGSRYQNTMTQWGLLRWGTLVDDVVLEDTVALARACAIQGQGASSLV